LFRNLTTLALSRYIASIIKVDAGLSLCLINYAPRHEDVWRTGGKAPPLLASALDEGERSASRFGHITSGKDPHRIGGWVGPRAGLDAVE
jgi:hypothetical protein